MEFNVHNMVINEKQKGLSNQHGCGAIVKLFNLIRGLEFKSGVRIMEKIQLRAPPP